MPLPREHLLDELATAYVQAVAATGGAIIARGRRDYGVDGTMDRVVQTRRFPSPGQRFVPSGFSVEFQLKGTTQAIVGMEHVLYDLDVRSYNLIVDRSRVATPLYLFLVCFGRETEGWISIDGERLVLNASGYWWTQAGTSSRNSSTVRIQIPVSNRLTSRAIEHMLMAAKNRF
jgi:hypothetical protein